MNRQASSPNPKRYTIRLRRSLLLEPTNATGMGASAPVGVMPESRQSAPDARANHNHNHNHNLTLQKYLLLQEQHEFLRQHLDELRPLRTSADTGTTTSPAVSPSRTCSRSSFFGPSPTSTSQPLRRTSLPLGAAWSLGLETIPDEATLSEVAAEEARLCHINEGIKRTLTELLNCETVRGDKAFRTWVQCRLMDTERELRSGRRRRSAPEP